ncbi:hypothetical protein V6N11_039573 [Hibiscus sabdariffa]|uniref:Uncharacterized protein n=1 Tax=Hibiscus sabdariffa TaxID=183260 RepID=A0ABR2SP27_9ROSI
MAKMRTGLGAWAVEVGQREGEEWKVWDGDGLASMWGEARVRELGGEEGLGRESGDDANGLDLGVARWMVHDDEDE